MHPTILFSALLLALVSADLTALFSKVQSGEGTYYGSTTGGHCSLDRPSSPFIRGQVNYPLAINAPTYSNSEPCGMCVQVYDTTGGLGANPVVAGTGWVNDECPECAPGDLDLGVSGDGRWDITWIAIPCPVGNTKFQYVFQGSNPWYLKLQVRNVMYPIDYVKVKPAGGTWTELNRQPDNFWVLSGGGENKFPIEVKVRSIFGELVQDTISSLVNDAVIDGSVQFKQQDHANATTSTSSTSSSSSSSSSSSTSSSSSSTSRSTSSSSSSSSSSTTGSTTTTTSGTSTTGSGTTESTTHLSLNGIDYVVASKAINVWNTGMEISASITADEHLDQSEISEFTFYMVFDADNAISNIWNVECGSSKSLGSGKYYYQCTFPSWLTSLNGGAPHGFGMISSRYPEYTTDPFSQGGNTDIEADLKLEVKIKDKSEVEVGKTATIKYTIKNKNEQDDAMAELSGNVGDKMKIKKLQHDDDMTCTFSKRKFTCEGMVKAGKKEVVSVKVNVQEEGKHKPKGEVVLKGGNDPSMGNNSDSDKVTV